MKVKQGLARMTDDELADYSDSVHTAMVANAATFTAPNPSMPTQLTQNTTFRASIATRIAGDAAAKTNVINQGAGRDVVIAGLTTQGAYVESRAAGNPAIIALSGMGVKAASAAIGAMPKVSNLKTTTSDHAGEVDWMCGPVSGAKAYIVQKCAGDPSVEANWSYASTETKSSGTLTGLASGNVWVRVAAKGAAADPGAWSDPAQEVVR